MALSKEIELPTTPGYWIDNTSNLQLRTWTTIANMVTEVHYRIEQPGLPIDQNDRFKQLAITTTNRSQQVFYIPLGNGFLSHVSILLHKGTPVRGQLFVQMRLTDAAGILVSKLFSGYVQWGQDLHWPPGGDDQSTEGTGYRYTAAGTAPAVSTDISDTVPANARWILRAIEADLVTGTVVNNRTVNLFIDDAQATKTRKLLLTDTTAQTASQTRTHGYYPGTDNDSTASVSVTDTQTILAKYPMSLQNGVILNPGDTIRTTTASISAGDQWSAARYVIEEYLMPIT